MLRRSVSPLSAALLGGSLLFLVLFLRSVPCVQTVPGTFDRFLYACYSDIQTNFLAQSMGTGNVPTTADELTYPPLLAVIIWFTSRVASSVLGAPVTRSATPEAQVEASLTFYSLTAVGLFVCFLALIFAVAIFGRRPSGAARAAGQRPRLANPWGWSSDAFLIALSPIVLSVGLVSWELIPLALAGVGLALFSTRRSLLAAIVLAIASCTGTMPIAVSIGLVVAIGLRGGTLRALRFGLVWLAVFVVVQLPLILKDFGRLWDFYRSQAGASPGFGSLWYLAKLWGFDQPHAGSLGFSALIVGLGCLFGLLRVTGRRPRVGALIALVVLAVIVVAPAFTPQTGLWVLFAVVIARPYRAELVAVTITQVLYAFALWGWLDGALTSTQSGPYWLYWLAILARAGVEIYLLARVLWDVLHPERDRFGSVWSDPLGGELHAVAPRPAPARPAPVPAEKSFLGRWRAPLIAAAIATFVSRFALVLAAYCVEWLMTTDQVKPKFGWDAWARWDALHFLSIAESGYGPEVVGGNAPAFFPLFPLAVRVVSAAGIEPLHAGILVSFVSTFVASAYLYRLAQLHGFDGDRSIVYLLLFPTGVFLVAPYTEALFLAGAVPAFYYAQRGRAWPAALFTAIAVGTRTVGLFVLLGVAVELARRAWPHWRRLASAVVAMVAASLPFWLYGLYLQRERGSFWIFMQVQKEGWGRDFTGFTDGFLTTWNTWAGDYGANIVFTWRVEVVFAALSLALMMWVMWRGYLGYAVYIGATLIIGLSNAWYYSTPRLALAFFPFAFMIAALVGKRERAHTYTVLNMTALATVGVVAYTRGAWFF